MILVDTYNVIHSSLGAKALSDDAGPGELAILIAAGRHRRDRVVLVCDGSPHPAHLGPTAERRAELRYRIEGVDVIYAGPGRDADTLIELMIERESAPRRLRVVSSDRRLVRAIRARKGQSVASHRFLSDLLADAERSGKRWVRPRFATEVPLSRPAVRYWHNLFGIDQADLPDDPAPQPPKPPATAEITPEPRPRADAAKQPDPPARRAPDPTDPLLIEALEEWRGRLSLDDLNMDQWLGDDSNSAQ